MATGFRSPLFLLGLAAGFPTQFSGLDVYYAGEIHHLCLVAEANGPGGMGGVLKVRLNSTNYAAYLVEIGSQYASNARVTTATGIKAVRLKT